MNSSKPYLIRALYEWIVDNQCTPYLLVAADFPGVQLPEGYAENGQMVLNVNPAAIRHLLMNNEVVSFEARFAGVAQLLSIPVDAVLAIYAQENGQGMFFGPEALGEAADGHQQERQPEPAAQHVDDSQQDGAELPPRPAGKPSLKLIK